MRRRAGGREIGAYLYKGSYYALEDICPHANALLSQGFVEGDEIKCQLHGARFHIPTGKCIKETADRDLKQYAVKVQGSTVYIDATD